MGSLVVWVEEKELNKMYKKIIKILSLSQNEHMVGLNLNKILEIMKINFVVLV